MNKKGKNAPMTMNQFQESAGDFGDQIMTYGVIDDWEREDAEKKRLEAQINEEEKEDEEEEEKFGQNEEREAEMNEMEMEDLRVQ